MRKKLNYAERCAVAQAKRKHWTCPRCGKEMFCIKGAFTMHLIWCNPENAVARFWANVDKKGADDCWPWLGQVRWDGYGRFVVMRKPQWTHRFSWELHNGRKLKKGELVLHSCGNAICCNPAHLSLGTQQENMADKKRLDRWFESLQIAKELANGN